VKKAFFAIIILTISLSCLGQEVLIGLSERPSLRHSGKPMTKLVTRGASTLSLPFFDDFAEQGSIPDTTLWHTGPVDMNQTYGMNPPSIGVATFDLLDGQGYLHTNASVDPFMADSLTSLPINLNYPGSNNIFFSFYYQPGGYGDVPDLADSLVLKFYSNTLKSWIKVWSANVASGTILENNYLTGVQKVVTQSVTDSFHHVMIQVNQSYFLTDSFSIKYYNIGSFVDNSFLKGFQGNADQWNIDMVYLNSGRTVNDTLLNDVAFSQPLGSLLQNYESIPWPHFTQGDNSVVYPQPDTLTTIYQNLGNTVWNVTRLFEITNELSQSTYSFSGGAENIYPLQSTIFQRLFNYSLTSPDADSAEFKVKAYLLTDIAADRKIFRWNDTITRQQVFKNYYAYDDGSAENGYGVYGEGAENAMVALKFTPLKADTLRGIYIYFNRTLKDPTAAPLQFYLKVWSDNNGIPGNEIYSQQGETPIYTDSLNKFAYIKLGNAQFIDGTFYVGWKQVTADMLNVGFDRNINSQSKLFYNLTGNWINSSLDGTLMLRPVFGVDIGPTTDVVPIQSTESMAIFPNPATDAVMVKVGQDEAPIPVMVFDMAGKLVKQLTANQQSSIVELPNGLYLVRVRTKNGVTTKKLIISR